MKKLLSVLGLGTVALLPSWAMAAAPAVADKADNAFMMICTALVLFMTIPGIALFYGGLLRSKKRIVNDDSGHGEFCAGMCFVDSLRLQPGV